MKLYLLLKKLDEWVCVGIMSGSINREYCKMELQVKGVCREDDIVLKGF